MAEEPAPKKKPQDPKKIAAGVVFLIVAVGILIHRLPKRGYVAAHADKPRAASAPAAPMEVFPGLAASQPAKAAPARPPAPAPASAWQARPEEVAEAPIPWEKACKAEIGILCHNVPDKRLRRCLGGYDDALRKGCFKALSLKPDEIGPPL